MVAAHRGWMAPKVTVMNEVADKEIRCPCWVSISPNSHLLHTNSVIQVYPGDTQTAESYPRIDSDVQTSSEQNPQFGYQRSPWNCII